MDSSSAEPNVAAAAASTAAAAATTAVAAADPSAAAANDASITPEQQQKDHLASCWAAAEAADATNDPSFDVFVALASAAEKSGDAAEVARALELLLKRFPLCYGYWKKLAEAKARLASAGDEGDEGKGSLAEEASAAFERGLAHVGSTHELWLAFASKLISSSEKEEKIRAVFERAVGESGDAWGAGLLWEAYAAWEAGLAGGGGGEEQGGGPAPSASASASEAPRRAAAVLFRGACQPIRDAEVLRARLHELASRHSVGELAASEEEAGAARAAARPAGGEGGAGVGGGEAAEDFEAAARAAWLSTLEGSSPEFARGLSLRERRYPFENRIRRPYWNSRPLDADQLRAWWSLLDDAEGLLVPMMPVPAGAAAAAPEAAASASASAPYSRDEIDRLYRRCLVACAAYPEFWRRRARWLLDNNDDVDDAAAALEAARAAASAAADVHCRSRPEALLFASRLDEAAGDFDAAREKLVRTRDVVSPGLAAAAAAVAHLDRRRAVTEFLGSCAAATTTKKGGKKSAAASTASLEEEARKRGAAAARLCLRESIEKAEAAGTAAARSCVAALALQAAALTSDDGDVAAGREALAKGLRAAPGEAAVWEAAATFEARWGGKGTGDAEASSAAAPPSAAAVAVAILQAAAAPPASSVPGLERAIAVARAELAEKNKKEKKEDEGGEENGGEEDKEEKEATAADNGGEKKSDEEVFCVADLPLPADAVRRARAAGFPLQAPFIPPGWPCPLPESRLSHADRAALSARSIALAEASSASSSASLAGGGSGVALLRDAAALHDQRFGYAQAAAANIAAAAAPNAAGGGTVAGVKRPYVPGQQYHQQQQQWQPRPRTFYPRPHYNPHWQQQQQQYQQQQYQQQQYDQQQQWQQQQYQQPQQQPPQQQWAAPQQNYQQP